MPELQDGFGGQCIRIAARWCSVFERFYSFQQPMESDINDVLLWLNLKLDIVGRSGSMLQSEGALHSKHVWTLSNEALQDIYIYMYVLCHDYTFLRHPRLCLHMHGIQIFPRAFPRNVSVMALELRQAISGSYGTLPFTPTLVAMLSRPCRIKVHPVGFVQLLMHDMGIVGAGEEVLPAVDCRGNWLQAHVQRRKSDRVQCPEPI